MDDIASAAISLIGCVGILPFEAYSGMRKKKYGTLP